MAPTCCSKATPAPPVANGLGMFPCWVILDVSQMTVCVLGEPVSCKRSVIRLYF